MSEGFANLDFKALAFKFTIEFRIFSFTLDEILHSNSRQDL